MQAAAPPEAIPLPRAAHEEQGMILRLGFALAQWICFGVLGTLVSAALGILTAQSWPALGAPLTVTWGTAESGAQMLRAESIGWTRVMAAIPARTDLDEFARRIPWVFQGMLPVAPPGAEIQLLSRDVREAFWKRREGTSWNTSAWRIMRDGEISGTALGAAPAWFHDRTGWNAHSGTLWALQVSDAIGWPMHAFIGTVTVAPLTGEPPCFAVETHGCVTRSGQDDWASGAVFAEDWPSQSGVIPFQPIAPGLAIDIAFWGFLGLGASAAWRAAARLRPSRKVRNADDGEAAGRALP